MSTSEKHRVCPVENAGGLDSKLRKLVQNPQKIVKDFISPDMTILDFGCGPGYFTVEIAKMLNGSGKIFAADLQEEMLNIVKRKIEGTALEKIISLHQCSDKTIGISEHVDFVLAFYVVHEVSDKESFFKEVKALLKPNGKLLIVEPKFHVNKDAFISMENLLESKGFKIVKKPNVFLSRACLCTV